MNVNRIASDYGISPEEVRARWLALRVAMWKSDFKRFCREVVKIRTKEGLLEPLRLNSAQTILHQAAESMLEEEGWVRLIGLKGRRQGFSTYVASRGYWRATLWDRQRIYILSHEMQSSNTLFGMVALMQENHPFPPAVGNDNAKELEFSKRGSCYTVATAGQKAGGRGGAISFFHGSEAAWWTNAPDHFASSVQAVDEVRGRKGILWTEPENPLPFEKGKGTIEGWVQAPSEIFLESTSAGPTGEFYKRYMDAMKGVGRYRAIFVPWTLQKEYNIEGDFEPETEAPDEGVMSEAEYQQTYKLTDSQMLWRRQKIHELGGYRRWFQEYPIDVQEAFSEADIDDIFITPMLVQKARKREMDDPDAPLILGVDCAGAGGDRFAVAARRGDKCLWVRYRSKLEHNEAVAWISQLIDEENPSRVCVDRGSMGMNIVSALRSMSPRYAELVRGIDFGGKSREKMANPTKAGPFNLRASIYNRLKTWLIEGGSIPDDDDLVSDLTAAKIKYRANNDWLLESKSDMKARGIRSPDLADALALTFSTTEFFNDWSKPKKKTDFRKGVEKVESVGYYDAALESNPTSWMA